VADLLQLHTKVQDELRCRKVLRSANGPTGDYGELLFSRAFGWKLESNSSSGHDAVDQNGLRYQIKCRRITKENSSPQLSDIRKLNDHPFDYLAGVILDKDFRVTRAALVPFDVVSEKAIFVAHVNAWRLMLRDAVWHIPGVQDVTNQLRTVQASL
jgi:hypothetical protein